MDEIVQKMDAAADRAESEAKATGRRADRLAAALTGLQGGLDRAEAVLAAARARRAALLPEPPMPRPRTASRRTARPA